MFDTSLLYTSGESLLHTPGARAVFWAFNGSSRARLYLDLAKEVADGWAAGEMARRAQHDEWWLYTVAICHHMFARIRKRKRTIILRFLEIMFTRYQTDDGDIMQIIETNLRRWKRTSLEKKGGGGGWGRWRRRGGGGDVKGVRSSYKVSRRDVKSTSSLHH